MSETLTTGHQPMEAVHESDRPWDVVHCEFLDRNDAPILWLPSLNLLVKDAMHEPGVAYVIIADHHGKVLAHSDVSLSGKALVRPANLASLGDTLMA